MAGLEGGSVLLPDSAQAANWFAASGLLGFPVTWTAEGVMGRKVVGRKGLLKRGIDSFIELTRDGMEVVGEALVHMWRRLLVKVGHPAGPPHLRRAVRVVVSALTLGVVALAWGFANLSGFSLLYIFEVTLYAIVIAFIFIGRLKKRSAGSLLLRIVACMEGETVLAIRTHHSVIRNKNPERVRVTGLDEHSGC